MMQVVRYEPSFQQSWDSFNSRSKNGLFIFSRKYMEYHADRFKDNSLMLLDEKGKIICLLPASIRGNVLASHDGLTFGGFVFCPKMTASRMLDILDAVKSYLSQNGIEEIIYKAIPSIFSKMPSEEDLYALHINNSSILKREISCAIRFEERIRFAKGKREGVKKALRSSLFVEPSCDFKKFFDLGRQVMESRHDLSPVHSSEEMSYLHSHFPEHIKLFACMRDEMMLAGSIIYKYGKTAHTQYMYNSDEGLRLGALDLVMSHIVEVYEQECDFLSFGISSVNEGRTMNHGLQRQKEMLGGRSVLHDTYSLSLE